MRTLFAAAALLALALPTAAFAQDAQPDAPAAMPAKKTVLVFGDSLTWGWVPTSPVAPSTRHAPADRWTGVLAAELGDGYEVLAEGLSGRTTNVDDPNDPKLNGSAVFPAILASHEPVDLVVILLGTNDTKTYLKRTPLGIALGAGELIDQVHKAPGWDWTDYPTPPVLLVSPPPLGATIGAEAAADFDATSQEKSRQLGRLYAEVAALAGEHSFDAGTVIETDGVDGIHFTADANRKLGTAVAGEVRKILGE